MRKEVSATKWCASLFRIAVCILLICLPGVGQSSGNYLTILVPAFSSGGFAAGEYPGGLAVDNLGNLYVADPGNNRICKISPQGTIDTIAGNGTPGFSGDDGPATAAELNLQQSQMIYSGTAWYYILSSNLAVDLSSNVYIVDGGNYRVRKVTSQGIITTVAGNGSPGYSGDSGSATSAQLEPVAVAVDLLGNLYIGDASNRVRVVDTTGKITTIAGNGFSGIGGDGIPANTAELCQPSGLAIDPAGDVIIADTMCNRIRRVSKGIITTIAGTGSLGFEGDNASATSAELAFPAGVATDSAGNIFIADTGNLRVREVTTDGMITTIAGNGVNSSGGGGGAATTIGIGFPAAIGLDRSGDVFFLNNLMVELIPTPTSTVGCTYSPGNWDTYFESAGGAGNLPIYTNATTCPWIAGSYADWLTINKPIGISTGQLDTVVSYTVAANQHGLSRVGDLYAAGMSFQINQSGLGCSLGVSPLDLPVGPSGVIGLTLTVTASASDCPWSAGPGLSWVSVTGGSNRKGSGTASLTVAPNTGSFRAAIISVAGYSVNIHQGAFGSCDIDGYGFTTVADVQQTINEALGIAAAADDLNSDQAVNVVDVQIDINASLTSKCVL